MLAARFMKRRKRILILAASWFQIPCIEYARKRGYEVITCDNRPGNPGHRLADRSLEISTVDQQEVLGAARALEIDGILAYGTDVAALTAAFVAEEMSLPTHPSMNPYG